MGKKALALTAAIEGDSEHPITQGLTNKEIGRVLFVLYRTVQGHLQNAYQKLGVDTRTKAVTLPSTDFAGSGRQR